MKAPTESTLPPGAVFSISQPEPLGALHIANPFSEPYQADPTKRGPFPCSSCGTAVHGFCTFCWMTAGVRTYICSKDECFSKHEKTETHNGQSSGDPKVG